MKKLFAVLLPAICAVSANAQPVLNKAFDYVVGDSMYYVFCDTTDAHPGMPGPGKTWQFDKLSAIDSGWVKIIPAAQALHGSQFPAATYAEQYFNGTEIYTEKNAGTSQTVGVAQGATIVSYPDGQLTVRRPVKYMAVTSDTFHNICTTGSYPLHGTGYSSITADAYGRLVLPNAVYDDVLRVRSQYTEYDTLIGLPGNNVITTTSVSYLWFDQVHAAALLKIDSISVRSAMQNQDYYSTAWLKNRSLTNINNTTKSKSSINASLNDRGITITSDMPLPSQCVLHVYNLDGKLLHSECFIMTGNVHVSATRSLWAPGMYFAVLECGNMEPVTFRLGKQ